MPGNANKRTTPAANHRKWDLFTARHYNGELADLCNRLKNLFGSYFNDWDIDCVIRFACTRHGIAHANLTLLKTYPELLEAISRAADLCTMEWDPNLEAMRPSMKKVIEVYHSVIKKASEGGCTWLVLRGIEGRDELWLCARCRHRCDSTERWRGLSGNQQLGGQIASRGCIE